MMYLVSHGVLICQSFGSRSCVVLVSYLTLSSERDAFAPDGAFCGQGGPTFALCTQFFRPQPEGREPKDTETLEHSGTLGPCFLVKIRFESKTKH